MDVDWNTQGKYNCYSYAVSGMDIRPRDSLPLMPGLVGGYQLKSLAPHEIRNALEADGLILSESNYPGFPIKKQGYYLIGVYSDTRPDAYSSDFHFVRQNEDGSWSHKQGFNNPPTSLIGKDVSSLHQAVSLDCAKLQGGMNFNKI